MRKWRVLAFAWLHPCFGGNGGLFFHFILSKIVVSYAAVKCVVTQHSSPLVCVERSVAWPHKELLRRRLHSFEHEPKIDRVALQKFRVELFFERSTVTLNNTPKYKSFIQSLHISQIKKAWVCSEEQEKSIRTNMGEYQQHYVNALSTVLNQFSSLRSFLQYCPVAAGTVRLADAEVKLSTRSWLLLEERKYLPRPRGQQ